ncbi:hypothetical protein [Erythrobacter sp. WG]|uniref:hypothetical protein n=1 Tax=Erythrobacter sp. WG TaxID=2985510 RepID=UPI002270C957|nr:hypothetical protein [Erythrobacter sp. WG]MCX9147875.1 hypothetical protein [Erythrobacter sp. WG]
MTKHARLFAPTVLAALLGACTIIPDPARPESAAVPPPGSAVALGQPVTVCSLVATPLEVVEDSRCPVNARCVWAGRLVVRTRIEGQGWNQTSDLVLGEPYPTRGGTFALVAGNPSPEAGTPTPREAYRFVYEPR